MWASDLVAKAQDPESAVTSSNGPPNYMMHLFNIRTPISAITQREQTNSIAINSLRDIRNTLVQLTRTVEIYLLALEEQQTLIEETSASHSFSDSVTPQEDVDHQ